MIAAERARRLLGYACLWFAAVGLVVAVAGDSALLVPWRTAAALALFDAPAFPPALEPFARLTFGILGGSIVGKWLAAYWLVRHPLAAGHRWAWDALAVGIFGWFALDSALSLAVGATFNVWMINLAPLALAGIPLWLLGRPKAPSVAPPWPSRAWAVLYYANVAFVAIGLVIVVAGGSPLFSIYADQISAAYFDGTMPLHASIWQRFLYGLIGAAFAAHFAMLAYAIRFAAGQGWVLTAVAVSMLGWFVVDTAMCLVHGGAFNVLMINLPSLFAIALPWLWVRRSAGAAA